VVKPPYNTPLNLLLLLLLCCLQIYVLRGAWAAAGHFVWGCWLLVNICFHYYQAVHVSPGYTSDIDLQVLLVDHIVTVLLAVYYDGGRSTQWYYCSGWLPKINLIS
jgi:hypothetical protein